MKKSALVISISALLFSCETKTQTGALVGTGVGVGAGALIGGPTGAVIGGAAGAATGALIGAALDDADRKALNARDPKTLKKIDQGQQLNVQDIKNMSKAGIKDDVIISQIHATGSQFRLTSADIVDLKNSGVSQKVINEMIKSGQ